MSQLAKRHYVATPVMRSTEAHRHREERVTGPSAAGMGRWDDVSRTMLGRCLLMGGKNHAM